MNDVSEAMHYFNKHETLYQEMRDAMSDLPADIAKLQRDQPQCSDLPGRKHHVCY